MSKFELQDYLDEVMDYFDFERVKQVMDYLNWTWYKYNRVPEIAEIRKFARKLITQTWEQAHEHQQEWSLNTGGFLATVVPDDANKMVSLRFVVEEYECCPDSDEDVITTINE